MSNKAHLRPHKRKRQAGRVTSILMVILILVVFALSIALAASGRGAALARFRLLRLSLQDRTARDLGGLVSYELTNLGLVLVVVAGCLTSPPRSR
jgi:hypothetical protein